MATISQLKIELDGIGHILADKKLRVPKYQRSYAWDLQNVNELLRDVSDAIRTKASEYFLGSVVTQGAEADLEIVDGQQRLATTSIVIAAIRDYLLQREDSERAVQIEEKFLLSRNLRTQSIEPKLSLNEDDNQFYRAAILSRPGTTDRSFIASKESHRRIAAAQKAALEFIEKLVGTTQSPGELLIDWIEFLEKNTKVIWVRVADDSNAFVIFETLNDRGVELSIADLLKNYLFGKAGSRLGEAQSNWNHMVGALETVGGENVMLGFIRQAWSARYGITREKDLFGQIKQRVVNEGLAISFSSDLASDAKLYAAMLNPQHEYWSQLGGTAKGHVETLTLLKLEQYRPLLLAVLVAFKPTEVLASLKYLVACSVRFLIVGGLGGGTLETKYCELAQKVLSKNIESAKALAVEFNTVVPSDSEFKSAFASARVSKNYLARYYLQVLERQNAGVDQPEWVPNDNADQVNLEHVLPQNPSSAWSGISTESAEVLFNRLGNLALLQQKVNSDLGNSGFSTKRQALQNSSFLLSKQIGEQDDWTAKEIDARQVSLSELAVKAWPIAVS